MIGKREAKRNKNEKEKKKRKKKKSEPPLTGERQKERERVRDQGYQLKSSLRSAILLLSARLDSTWCFRAFFLPFLSFSLEYFDLLPLLDRSIDMMRVVCESRNLGT